MGSNTCWKSPNTQGGSGNDLTSEKVHVPKEVEETNNQKDDHALKKPTAHVLFTEVTDLYSRLPSPPAVARQLRHIFLPIVVDTGVKSSSLHLRVMVYSYQKM